MLRCIILLSAFSASLRLWAQDSSVIRQLSGLEVTFLNNATLGGPTAAVEFPIHSGKKALNRMTFWVTGTRGNDTLIVADDVFSNKTGWRFGPAGMVQKYALKSDWGHFFEVTSADVAEHKMKYKNSGYAVPDNILHWPSNYDRPGFPKVIAPYADVDRNGYYEPFKGDYPFIPGDSNIFTTATDSTSALIAGKNDYGIDRSVLWFNSTEPGTPGNTLFFRLTLCNRDTATFNNLKISAVADFAIGDPNDNFMVTDVSNSAVTGYNSSPTDVVYGNSWPAVSVGWLSRKATSSIYFENNADGVVGKPVKTKDFYNLANGYWKTGKFLSFGSSGVDGSTPAKFVYSNGTDPEQANADWDEVPGSQGRRTAVLSTGGWSVSPGSCVLADGFVTIIPNNPDSAKISNVLSGVHTFYESGKWTAGKKGMDVSRMLNAYPNPVQMGGTITIPSQLGDLDGLYTMDGKFCDTERITSNQFRITQSPGIYVLYFSSGRKELLLVQ